MKKICYRNNPKPIEKLFEPHNERGLPSKNYNRGKNGREESGFIELDDERGLQKLKQRELIFVASLDLTNLPRMAENQEEEEAKVMGKHIFQSVNMHAKEYTNLTIYANGFL